MLPPRPPSDDGGCPREDELVEFINGRGDPERVEAIERHLDQCSRCGETIALFGGAFASAAGSRTSGGARPVAAAAEPQEDPSGAPFPGPSSYADRYVLSECVGFGAGGIVYRARDVELDRDVALKVLRSDDEQTPRHQSRSARWRREAKIMARVVHPNVVTVHDVGVFGGRMFIATEFVEGGTLRQWLDERPRPWPEITRVFVDAAQGLRAIHERGLVHRDFKPQNVMMGRDGRVRVTDFGLARLLPEGAPTVAESSPCLDPLESMGASESLTVHTRTGALVGTPAYMSPEQWQGIPATPRSDQFSLCVALYEALFAERPWVAHRASVLAYRVCHTPPAPPKGGVPAWLTRALLRGLSRRPEDRFEDMTAFITTLERAPRRRRRWALGMALGGGFATVAAASYGLARVERAEPCSPDVERFANVWDEPTAARVTDPLGPALRSHVREVLDPWRDTWLELDQRACRMRADHEWSERQHRLTTACLDRGLAALRAVTETLQGAEIDDPDTVYDMLGVLRDPLACDDPSELEALQPSWGSVEAEQLAQASAPQVERVRVMLRAGRLDDALALAESLVEQADAQGDPALRAEALVVLGNVLTKRERHERAVTVLEDAVWAAEASGHVHQAALGWIELVEARVGLGRMDEAEAAVDRASAAVHRLGSPELRLTLASNRAVLASRQGRYAEALAQHQMVLEEAPAVWSPDDPQLTRVHINVAVGLGNLGRVDEAIEHTQVALAQHEQRYSGAHPVALVMLSNLGVLQFKQRDLPGARASLERSLAMAEELYEPTHPQRLTLLNNLAQLDDAEGDKEQARRRSEQVLALRRQRHGDEHPDVASALHNLAGMNVDTGREQRAEAQFREALAMRRRLEGERHPSTALTMHTLGRLLVKLERFDEAAELLSLALEIRNEINGDPVRRAATTFWLAICRAGQGRHALASRLGQRALELLDPSRPRDARMRDQIEDWLATLGSAAPSVHARVDRGRGGEP